MESLGTQTGILPIRWILAWIALLQVVVLQVVIIGAENLDPVQFTLSANFPKNKSLNPLPKHFDKFGDSENDCCTLVLFFEVKDLDMEGDSEDPPNVEGAQAHTGTGEATFKFSHPDIRDTDKSFTMDVAMDQDLVKSRHILNFDTCSSIIQKTYNIFATTSITDVKDVKVIVVNGKDDNIKCQDSTTIRPTPITPISNKSSKTTEIPVIKAEVSQLTVGLAIMGSVSTLVSIVLFGALVYVVKRYIPKNDTTEARYRSGNEKCVPGGDDSDDDDNENCIVKGGGEGVTTTGLEKRAKTCKTILIIAAIFCLLLAIISVVAILVTM